MQKKGSADRLGEEPLVEVVRAVVRATLGVDDRDIGENGGVGSFLGGLALPDA